MMIKTTIMGRAKSNNYGVQSVDVKGYITLCHFGSPSRVIPFHNRNSRRIKLNEAIKSIKNSHEVTITITLNL